jgi:SPP1 gp7 family putative phage head morphogenesis protein
MAALDIADLTTIFRLPPAAAVAYLKAKGVAVTWGFQEMLDAAHQRAFTAAGILKVDALEAIRASLVQAMEKGIPYRAWVKTIVPELEKRGLLGRYKLLNPETGEIKTLTPWRLLTIYETNLQSAFMAGRYAQMKATTDSHPYWQYVAVMDGRTRPSHAAMNGRTFRHDDPVWAAGFYPPLGYRCRCRIRPMTEAAIKRERIALSSSQGRLSQIEVEAGRGALARPAMVARFEVIPGQYAATDPGFAHSPANAVAWLEQTRQQRLTGLQR